ncbi:MAG: hypothetical protein ACC657_14610 [Thiohalomonadales bacterium]
MKIFPGIKQFIIILISLVITMNQSIADIANSNQHKIIDGISIYLGILPAEIIEGPAAISMHGGLPVGQYRYHVSIAIFNKNGKRLNNANIAVRLSTPDNKTEFISLEEMPFNNNLIYGNYFTLHEFGPYRIEVNIKHPNYPKLIKTEFQYQISHAFLTTQSRVKND